MLIGWKGTEKCFILMTNFQNETFHLIAEFIMKQHHFTVLCIFHTLERKHKPDQGQTYCTRQLQNQLYDMFLWGLDRDHGLGGVCQKICHLHPALHHHVAPQGMQPLSEGVIQIWEQISQRSTLKGVQTGMEAKHTSPHYELPWGNSFHS